MAAVKQRLTPTLFDKLVADIDMAGLRSAEGDQTTIARENFRFYTVPQLERFNEAALRARLRTALPSFMQPARYDWRDGLPRNANGKLDRAAIAADVKGMAS